MTGAHRRACGVAAAVWVMAGSMLLWRGSNMLLERSEVAVFAKWTAAGAGLLLGYLKGNFVLVRTARRNRARIESTPSPRPFAAFTPRFALLIGLMIAFGMGLRALAEQDLLGWVYVGALYIGIGAALLASAPAYLRARPSPLPTDPGPAEHGRPEPKQGVLLINLGTPDAPTPAAVTRYLREFLSDPRVVDASPWLWVFVLNLIVIPLRRRRVAEAYQLIWGEGGSPLLTNTQAAASALGERLPGVPVAVGMRYGSPSLASSLEALRSQGVEEVIAVPLFPQASDTTSGTVQLALARAAAAHREAPALSVVGAFPDSPAYIGALAARVQEAQGPAKIDRYVFSFHGLPERYVRLGDPYLAHCQRTARALAAHLELDEACWEMAFQSRFGDEPWLQPYLDERLRTLAREGSGRVLVALPGFAADCLETLEEVGVGLAREFTEAGGEELVVVPALNAHPAWICALEALVLPRIRG